MTNNIEPKLIAQWIRPEEVSEASELACDDVCIHCKVNGLLEGQENLSAEAFDLS